MKAFMVLAITALLVSVPALVPNIDITSSPATATPTSDINFAGISVSVSRGGEAHAWNLIAELCALGVPGMCDLYWHGQDEGWWS